MIHVEFDQDYYDKFKTLKLISSDCFRLGTYTPELFNKVKGGAIILGHCDGGYNEFLMLSSKLPESLLFGTKDDGEWVIVDITNFTFIRCKSPKDIVLLNPDDCYDQETKEWVSSKEWLLKYEDKLPC